MGHAQNGAQPDRNPRGSRLGLAIPEPPWPHTRSHQEFSICSKPSTGRQPLPMRANLAGYDLEALPRRWGLWASPNEATPLRPLPRARVISPHTKPLQVKWWPSVEETSRAALRNTSIHPNPTYTRKTASSYGIHQAKKRNRRTGQVLSRGGVHDVIGMWQSEWKT